MKKIFQSAKIVAPAVLLSVVLSYVYAWTSPTLSPASGNVTAPLNVSSTGQTKVGDLTISSNLISSVFKDFNDPTNFFLNPNSDSILADVYSKPNPSGTQTGSLYALGDICGGSTGSGNGVCVSSVADGTAGGGGSVFSSESDGDVVLSSNKTFDRDYNYNNLTINSGVTLNTHGYRLLVADTLVNNGTILTDGTQGTLAGGGSGGYGMKYCQNSNQCAVGTSVYPSLGSAGGAGGRGCSGGGVTPERVTIGSEVMPNLNNLVSGTENQANVSDMSYYLAVGATNGKRLSASAGGGGGWTAGNGVNNCGDPIGGSGGNGGGVVMISAKTLNNLGIIQAKGGDGGGGIWTTPYGSGSSNPWTSGGGSCGGGGGGGGVVVLIYKNLTNLGTINVNGGAGGIGGKNPSGNTSWDGQDGSAGSVGKIYRAKIQ